ncbi:dihydroneopterin aldolase [Massilia sp. TS11]|uniref:dihydroneopterin aldolase n=1 Tax=Massilia sp. TS11 TaxID=2908003 RepID=UPI001EDB44A9|nr:dihydroneopterin aldolase [Massilia sp. TS11]MCG2582990.1 dihydroneopterin aldolase [Massilia sp. TS11]
MLSDHYKILLKNVAVNTGIGIHDHERQGPQKLLATVELTVPLETIGRARSIHDTVDYDPIRAHIVNWASQPHAELLEDLLWELVGVCFADPKVEHVSASVRKPDIFPETEEAGVVMNVRRATWQKMNAS